MALINLALIKVLYNEAAHNKDAAIRQSFNLPEQAFFGDIPKPMSDALYVQLIKTHAQAEVIHGNLTRLYQVCADFADGRLEAYIKEFNEFERTNESDPEEWAEYGPFGELDILFNNAHRYPLPERIEQYNQLLDLCKDFTNVRRLKREGSNPYISCQPLWYEYKSADGQTSILPPHELPEEFLVQQISNDNLRNAAVEHCLDGYNEFRQQASALISSHFDSEGDEMERLTVCSKAILSLYDPIEEQ